MSELTDEEIEIVLSRVIEETNAEFVFPRIAFARAVIAADREANRKTTRDRCREKLPSAPKEPT